MNGNGPPRMHRYDARTSIRQFVGCLVDMLAGQLHTIPMPIIEAMGGSIEVPPGGRAQVTALALSGSRPLAILIEGTGITLEKLLMPDTQVHYNVPVFGKLLLFPYDDWPGGLWGGPAQPIGGIVVNNGDAPALASLTVFTMEHL